jgi:hypothetical protein
MADVSNHAETYGLFIQALCGARSPYATAILETGMFGDCLLATLGATWEELSYSTRELFDIFPIELYAPLRGTFVPAGSDFAVCQAFLLRPLQSPFFDQQTLAFISLAGSAPLQDHCRQS